MTERDRITMEKIDFETDEGTVSFYVMDQTRVNGRNYLLVVDSLEEEDAQAIIMVDVSTDEDSESIYEIVEDDNVLKAVAKIFEETLEDVSFM